MAKDSPRTTSGELQKIVESWGQKTLKKGLGGFHEKFYLLIQIQTPAYSVVRHDWNFKWYWLLWSD